MTIHSSVYLFTNIKAATNAAIKVYTLRKHWVGEESQKTAADTASFKKAPYLADATSYARISLS